MQIDEVARTLNWLHLPKIARHTREINAESNEWGVLFRSTTKISELTVTKTYCIQLGEFVLWVWS